jgi:hypothetical protein
MKENLKRKKKDITERNERRHKLTFHVHALKELILFAFIFMMKFLILY